MTTIGYKIIVIVGLPGSGKTTLAENMLDIMEAEYDEVLFADDFSKFSADYLVDHERGQHQVILITDPMLCNVKQEDAEATLLELFRLLPQEVSFEWIYFANDPEACLANAAREPKPGGTKDTIRHMSRRYVIPEGARVVDVYRPLH